MFFACFFLLFGPCLVCDTSSGVLCECHLSCNLDGHVYEENEQSGEKHAGAETCFCSNSFRNFFWTSYDGRLCKM